eukprot:NODE_1496_length_2458_cov_4.869584.p1 GENE.NODE_1496_length_2458_cov_4.869584~~NODE_1496_length_2458_cov_4.869584.p1  ORF type:complete len:347 (+),score=74.48 NODE_1496_length_2458_cov_4.869584:713-1753(+)
MASVFSTQSLANLAWAFAMLGIPNEPLLKAIAASALPLLADFSPHDLAYLAWAYAQLGMHDEPLLDSLASEVRKHIRDFSLEDLAKTSWSWATLAREAFRGIVHSCLLRALASPPVSTWRSSELLDTAHAFAWSAWSTGEPEFAWRIFHAWASHGMIIDAASFGLLMMDAAYERRDADEARILAILEWCSTEQCSDFAALRDVFAWCRSHRAFQAPPHYSMRFDVRICPGGRRRGTHAKLALLVADVKSSGACDAETLLEAVRQHSFGVGQWLKVAGGGKANLLERTLRARPSPRLLQCQQQGGMQLALEFGVFVGYTTTRLGQRAVEKAACVRAPKRAAATPTME